MANFNKDVLIWIVLISSIFQLQVVTSASLNGILPIVPIDLIEPADYDCPSGEVIGSDDYPHETRCEAYYTCYPNGTSILFECTHDTLFDVEKRGCDYARDVHCWDRIRPENVSGTKQPPATTVPTSTSTSTSKTTTVTTTRKPTSPPPDDSYECKENGAFPHPKYCDLYFDCWDEVSTLLKCPPTGVEEGKRQEQLFDTEYFGCKIAVETDCGNRTRPDRPDFTCPDLNDAYYTDPNNCAGFYRCVLGDSTHYLCPEGLLFNPDPDVAVCDFPANVVCDEKEQRHFG